MVNDAPRKIKYSGENNGGDSIKRQTKKSKIGNRAQKQAGKEY